MEKAPWWRLCLRPKTCKEFETWADNIIALAFEFTKAYFMKTAAGLSAFFMKYSCICGGSEQRCYVEKQIISKMFTSAWKYSQTKESNPLPRKINSVNSFCTVFCSFLMLAVFILGTTKFHPLTPILYAHYLFPKASGMQSHLVFKVLPLKLYSKIGSKIFWTSWLNVLAAVAVKT